MCSDADSTLYLHVPLSSYHIQARSALRLEYWSTSTVETRQKNFTQTYRVAFAGLSLSELGTRTCTAEMINTV
jgi:hypothetical protein